MGNPIRRWKLIVLAVILMSGFLLATFIKVRSSIGGSVGNPIDSLDGVIVYYNGEVDHASGRNATVDNYNLGLKYQCVEFVKRYYLEHLNHKMPDTYGHAKDYFDDGLRDGSLNRRRNLVQYSNPSRSKPAAGDILIFGATALNEYGHVAIVSRVGDGDLEIIQQNAGPFAKTRAVIIITRVDGLWEVKHDRVKGWLRKK